MKNNGVATQATQAKRSGVEAGCALLRRRRVAAAVQGSSGLGVSVAKDYMDDKMKNNTVVGQRRKNRCKFIHWQLGLQHHNIGSNTLRLE